MRRAASVLLFACALGAAAWFVYGELIAPRLARGPAETRPPAARTRPSEPPAKEPVPPAKEPVPPAPPEETLPEEAVVLGRVLDRGLSPVEGAVVALEIDGGDPLEAPTGADGAFRFPSVPSRAARAIRVRAEGHPEPPPRPLALEGAVVARINWVLGTGEGAWIRPGSVLSLERSDSLAVFAEGEADLPDGSMLVLTLVYGEKIHFREQIEVEGGRFDGVMRPPEGGYFSGAYRLEIDFDPRLQTREIREALPDGLREIQIAAAPFYVGDPASEAAYDADLLRYYGRVLGEVRPLLEEMETAADLAVGAEEDPDARRVKRERLRQLAGADPVPGGRFDPRAWRAWMDGRMRPRIDALLQDHQARGRAKYPEVENRLGFLLGECSRLARIVSVRAYRHNGRPPDPADLYAEEFGPDPDQKVALARIRSARRFIVRWIRARRPAASPAPATGAPG